MKRRTLLAGLALSACTSAEPAYYTLAAVPGVVGVGGPKLVEVQRPGLAGYLDRPGIVRADSAYRLRVAGMERWGEPLGDLIGRVLAENLNQRLPGSSVFTTAGTISADPDATVQMDVQRFDADAGGQVVLLAQVAVSHGRNRANAITQTVRQTMRPAGPATADLVAAMSAVLGQLADSVAATLRSSRAGRT